MMRGGCFATKGVLQHQKRVRSRFQALANVERVTSPPEVGMDLLVPTVGTLWFPDHPICSRCIRAGVKTGSSGSAVKTCEGVGAICMCSPLCSTC